jgi:hypothetical protein
MHVLMWLVCIDDFHHQIILSASLTLEGYSMERSMRFLTRRSHLIISADPLMNGLFSTCYMVSRRFEKDLYRFINNCLISKDFLSTDSLFAAFVIRFHTCRLSSSVQKCRSTTADNDIYLYRNDLSKVERNPCKCCQLVKRSIVMHLYTLCSTLGLIDSCRL